MDPMTDSQFDVQPEPQAMNAEDNVYADTESVAEYDSNTPESMEALPALDAQPIRTRIDELTESIEQYLDAPSNYVYRGEALLEEGQDEWAVQDFTVALQLAKAQALVANWGYIYQVLYERAQEGLRRAQA